MSIQETVTIMKFQAMGNTLLKIKLPYWDTSKKEFAKSMERSFKMGSPIPGRSRTICQMEKVVFHFLITSQMKEFLRMEYLKKF